MAQVITARRRRHEGRQASCRSLTDVFMGCFFLSSEFSLGSDLSSLSGFGGSGLGSVTNWQQQQQMQNLQPSALGHMG